ncbi:MAG: metalloregulator ArsR/SmtB family transcription factor [Verrucomicrobiota bacterium]
MTGLDPTMLTATFSALADPTRRAILERLSKGEATVTELAEPLHMSLPAVSKHLKVLERAGLLQRRRDGRQHIMNFDGSKLRDAADWIERYRRFWEGNFDRLAQYLDKENSQPKKKKQSK